MERKTNNVLNGNEGLLRRIAGTGLRARFLLGAALIVLPIITAALGRSYVVYLYSLVMVYVIVTLGLNILNMAIIAPLVTYGVMMLFGKNRTLGTPVAAWAAVFIAATVCAAQLALSYSISDGTYGITGALAFPAMMGYHALIGVGEAIVTTGVVLFLAKVSPEMLELNLKPAGA